MIKLVVSDIDGTLIDSTEQISTTAVALAAYLRSRGVLFTIATGRAEWMARGIVQTLGIEIPYIACNGAVIVQSDRVLLRKQIPVSGLRQIIERADQEGLSVIYSIDGEERVWRFTQWVRAQQKEFDRYHEEHRFAEAEWETVMVDKITVMDDTLNGCIAEYDRMCEQLPAQYGYTRYLDRAVEVVAGDATKGNAMKILAGMLGIPLGEVMAAGDHQNDLEMIRAAGIGVAVANATDALKAQADYLASKEDVEGIFEAIRRFIP